MIQTCRNISLTHVTDVAYCRNRFDRSSDDSRKRGGGGAGAARPLPVPGQLVGLKLKSFNTK